MGRVVQLKGWISQKARKARVMATAERLRAQAKKLFTDREDDTMKVTCWDCGVEVVPYLSDDLFELCPVCEAELSEPDDYDDLYPTDYELTYRKYDDDDIL